MNIDKEKQKSDDEDFENLETTSESEDQDESNEMDNDSEDDKSITNDGKDKVISNKKVRTNIKKRDDNKVKKKKKPQKIIFNVSDTQYDVIKYVGKKIFKWKLSYEPEGEWDIFWTDNAVQPETLAKMQPFQKINHFPGMYSIARKNHLGRNLMRMRKAFQENYNFFPPTWLLPADFSDFKAQFKSNKKKTFIIKPEASCQGRGIFLTKTWENIKPTDHYVAQRYINKPYLIDGLKFDLRIYVLLAGCDPLKIFLFHEGLARFATEEYKEPNEDNIEDVCMHLTNYAINKENPNFIFNEDADTDDVGHKRSVTSVFKLLESQGHDIPQVWNNIKKIIIKTFCSIQPILAHNYKSCQPDEPYNNMCFEILGFDIMLDHKLKPWLIEVNHTPSFTTDTPLDRNIKKNVIRDTLNIMNISIKNKIKWKNKKRLELQQRVLTGKKVVKTIEEKQSQFDQAQKERNEWEISNLGGFTKIFPFDNPNEPTEPYDEFIKESHKWWQEWTGTSIKRNTKKVVDDKFPRFTFSMEKSALDTTPPIIKKKQVYQRSNTQILNSKSLSTLDTNPNFVSATTETNAVDIQNQNEGNCVNTEGDQQLPLITEEQIEAMIESEDQNYLVDSKAYLNRRIERMNINHIGSPMRKHFRRNNSFLGERTDIIPEDANQDYVHRMIQSQEKFSVYPQTGNENLLNEENLGRSGLVESKDMTRNLNPQTFGFLQPFTAKAIKIPLNQSPRVHSIINKQTHGRGNFEKYIHRDSYSSKPLVSSVKMSELQQNFGGRIDSINQLDNVDDKSKAMRRGFIEISPIPLYNRSLEKPILNHEMIQPQTQSLNNLKSNEPGRSNQLPKMQINFCISNMNQSIDKHHSNIFMPSYIGSSSIIQMPKLDSRIKIINKGISSYGPSNDTNNINNNNNNSSGLIIKSNKSPLTMKNAKSCNNSGNYLQPKLIEFFGGNSFRAKFDEDYSKGVFLTNKGLDKNNYSAMNSKSVIQEANLYLKKHNAIPQLKPT